MGTVVWALTLAAVLFFLPVVTVGGNGLYQSGEEEPEATLPIDRVAVTTGARDKGKVVRLQLEDGTVQEMTMADYLWGVVAAEMPASFEPEALKAQTVAARTYTLSKMERTVEAHPDADVCTDITCCQAYIDPADAAANWGENAQT